MFKKNFLTSALFAVLFSVSVSFASYVPEDAFTAEEFDDVLEDVFNSEYMKDETLAMYQRFLNTRTIWVGGAPAVYFDYKVFGKQNDAGDYPLYISLHGGGGVPKELNDEQWRNQISLYTVPYGIYVAPRAPWNEWNMWFQEPVDRIIEEIIKVFHYSDYNIDLNRVYLLGYSAGGDGVWRLATRMPDAFASASMMAGHPGDVSLVNLYNLPFMVWVGEYDSAYNRNAECAKRIRELEELRSKSNENGYVFSGNIIKGKGHWMDNEDRAAIPWMSKFSRDQYPAHVVWRQEEVLRNHMYQLETDVAKTHRGDEAVVDFDFENNRITILRSDYDVLYININDEMFDMDKKITVVNASGKVLFDDKVYRTRSSLLHSLHIYGGIYGIYTGQIAVRKEDVNGK